MKKLILISLFLTLSGCSIRSQHFKFSEVFRNPFKKPAQEKVVEEDVNINFGPGPEEEKKSWWLW